MSPDQIVLQAATGLANAMLLVLVSTGLSLIFGVSRIINLAHGSFYMLGAYTMLTVVQRLSDWGNLAFWIGLGVSALVVAVVGEAIELLLLRRIYGSNELFQLLLTFSLVLIISELVRIIWGSGNQIVARPSFLAGSTLLFDRRVPTYLLFVIAVGPIVALGLWALLYRTPWGILIRAATQDREMVGALGVNANRLFTQVFVLAAGLAGLSGALAAPLVTLTPGMDNSILLEAFVVVVVGGLGSVGGAIVAALLVGELRAFGIRLFPDTIAILPFVLMAVVLVIRPWGLLGKPERDQDGHGAFSAPRLAAPLWQSRRVRFIVGAALAIIALLVPWVLSTTWVNLAITILLLTLFGASVNLLLGTAGLVSFGHALYFGCAAYATAITIQRFGWSPWLAFAAGPLVAALVALLVGALAVRRSGVYFAMLTLAFAQVGYTVATQMRWLTGGEDGIIDLALPGFTAPGLFYYLALALVALCGGALFLLDRSAFGYTLRAIREHRRRTELIGVPVRRGQLMAFVISGFFAGVAGTLFMFFNRGAFPAFLFWTKSVDPLAVTVLGGVGNFFGPVVGAITYGLLTHFTAMAGDRAQLALGLALLVIVLLFPRGLPAVVAEGWALLRKNPTPRHPEGTRPLSGEGESQSEAVIPGATSSGKTLPLPLGEGRGEGGE